MSDLLSYLRPVHGSNPKWTVAVDFDGVIHSYVSPWVNARIIPDPPVDGAISWLFETIQSFNVAILSTRNHQFGGKRAMRHWLKASAGNVWYDGPGHRGLENIAFPKHKPAALVYIDDRAVRFTGSNWPSKKEIHRLRPWNKEVR